MMKKIPILLLLFLTGCEVNINAYDSGAAATHSLKYLEMLFLKGQIKETYLEIHQSFKDEITEDAYIKTFTQAANAVNAEILEAKKYEYIGGDIGEIHVYFLIKGQSGSGFIRVKLADDNDTYQVFGIKTIDTLPKKAIYGGSLGEYEKGEYTSAS